MPSYNELFIQERNKLFRILTWLLCAIQMFNLIIHFSHQWSHISRFGHFTVVELLVTYPLIALYSLKKQPDPFLIAMMAYAVLTLTFAAFTIPM